MRRTAASSRKRAEVEWLGPPSGTPADPGGSLSLQAWASRPDVSVPKCVAAPVLIRIGRLLVISGAQPHCALAGGGEI